MEEKEAEEEADLEEAKAMAAQDIRRSAWLLDSDADVQLPRRVRETVLLLLLLPTLAPLAALSLFPTRCSCRVSEPVALTLLPARDRECKSPPASSPLTHILRPDLVLVKWRTVLPRENLEEAEEVEEREESEERVEGKAEEAEAEASVLCWAGKGAAVAK